MDGLYLSAHASARMRQRGIQKEVVETLFAHGRCERSHGADVYFMDRQTRQRAREELGAKDFSRLEKSLNTYLVVGEDGTVVTTARRLRRFHR